MVDTDRLDDTMAEQKAERQQIHDILTDREAG